MRAFFVSETRRRCLRDPCARVSRQGISQGQDQTCASSAVTPSRFIAAPVASLRFARMVGARCSAASVFSIMREI